MEACYDYEVSNCEISGGICESNSLACVYIYFFVFFYLNDQVIIYTSGGEGGGGGLQATLVAVYK